MRDAVVEHVLDAAAPAVAALIGGQPVEHGAVGGLLQIEIEGGVDAQAGLVNLFGAEPLFELAADFLLEPGSDRHLGLGDVQAERRLAGLVGLGVGDDPVRLHLAEHQVAAAEGLVGIEQRRIGGRPLGRPASSAASVRVRSLACLVK